MPSYNAASYISSTIESVLAQTYAEWELLIVDDCSKDSTRALVHRFEQQDRRIKLIPLEKNNGAPAAPRNIGIRTAGGEWIAFLDADDIWHPRKLEIQLEIMRQEGVFFSSTLSRNFIDEKLVFNQKIEPFPSFQKITFHMQRIKGRIANSSVICHKSLLLKYPFNEDVRYKAVEDYHCWLRIHSDIGHSLRVNAVLLNYRIIEGQISGSKLYMLKRMLMLHREFKEANVFLAIFFTMTHAIGGVVNKYIKKGF
jgi:teichuronic acid biosynthesis glycosyltransferase TuaG